MKSLLYDPHEIGLITGKSMGEEIFVNCPFHGDTHPSAEFNLVTGRFYCFACGARSYAHYLAQKLGGTCHQEFKEIPAKDSEEDEAWKTLLNAPLAYGNLYLKKRGVFTNQILKYDIRSVDWGVIFPLRNENGKVVGVLARKYEGTQKYLVFGEKVPVYPLDKLSNSIVGDCVVTEGVFGVLAADRAGIDAISTLSAMVKESAGIWLNQINPIVCFDDDDSGYKGAAKILKLNPFSRVVVSGDEFDNLTPTQFSNIIENPYGAHKSYTSSIHTISEFTEDNNAFFEAINSFGKYIKRKSYERRVKSNLSMGWMRG